MYSIATICQAVHGRFLQQHHDDNIENLAYDSRRIQEPASSVFFALRTERTNGHDFLLDAWKKGVRNFIVSGEDRTGSLTGSNVILVEDTLAALQALAGFHRRHYNIPIIGITGSNGKTIVKEWLFQLLHEEQRIVRSPKSFNSQIGVPLSVWQLNEQHELAIFEAGISRPGEMKKLADIIQPTIGVFTNLGEAHSEGFRDNSQKVEEKLLLFADAGIIIFPFDDEQVRKAVNAQGQKIELVGWGKDERAACRIMDIRQEKEATRIQLKWKNQLCSFTIPFTDEAAIENAISCCCVLLVMGKEEKMMREGMAKLHAIEMRLQLKHSFNDCLVINDSYSSDITSLKIALDFMKQQGSGLSRTVILSEFLESGKKEEDLYREIGSLLQVNGIRKAFIIGEKAGEGLRPYLSENIALHAYLSTDDFIKDFKSSRFFSEIILIKGARRFGFERIAALFERKLHETVLEINLNALAHNLKEYQEQLQPGTKVMAMVKAFSYGSGGAEIASVLQYHNTGYLGVAYADEGVDLVKAGITLPIMVMNTEVSSFQSIVDYNLQPAIYSFALLEGFEAYLREQGLSAYPVHLEIETGMNRLGFAVEDTAALGGLIAAGDTFRIQSVFTHLAASEDPAQDDFTGQQHALFLQATQEIGNHISYPFLKHIANSAAIIRHPQLQMDMVRLGIGLYGVEIDNHDRLNLQAVATLRSTIAQLKQVKKGASVSYNRKGIVDRDSVIATVRIGYADGYSRRFGTGRGKMLVQGKRVPVVGTVCMDMTMIDVTDLPGVKEGDEVIIFGPALPVQELAAWIDTIPYEIMTGVSQRVKRIYFHE